MDHESAIRTRAAERYLLGEIGDEERERFEEHFFSCPVCADDVRSASEFASGARAVFREERDAVRSGPSPVRIHSTPWWKGSWALSASACLNVALLAVSAALGVLIVRPLPVQDVPEAHFVQEVPVLGPQRGSDPVREIARQTAQIVIAAFLPDGAGSLRYQILDAGGKIVRSGEMGPPPRESSGQSLLSIPVSSLAAGEYRIVLMGQNRPGELLGSRTFRIGSR